MTLAALIEWAGVVLPLLALAWGMCLVAIYPDVIEAWVAKLDAWWIDHVGHPTRKP